MVKKKELRNMSKEDLDKQLKELKMELIKSNSQVKSGSAPKNPGQIKQMKKTIAKILTLKNQGGIQKG